MKPKASISLDLDNKWSYLKTYGDRSWQEYPSYLGLLVPRILQMMESVSQKTTVMIVGQDAARSENADFLRAFVDAEHDIGNHSFNHEPWLHLYSRDQLQADFDRSEDAIATATGQRPTGFRGPGFSLSELTIRELAARDYHYDATIFPNLLNPLGRAYYFMKSNLSREERKQRKALFGTLGDAFRPNRPFRWELDEGPHLLEIPVTTVPWVRIPFHMSYLIYLATYSRRLARTYLRTALALCRITDTPPSMLLHPLDFLGKNDDSDLGFFPGMHLESGQKLDLLEEFLLMFKDAFEVESLGSFAHGLGSTALRKPHFRETTHIAPTE